MNFVADESCAKPVVLALREAGHDVWFLSLKSRQAQPTRKFWSVP
jgi:hypothetical protein